MARWASGRLKPFPNADVSCERCAASAARRLPGARGRVTTHRAGGAAPQTQYSKIVIGLKAAAATAWAKWLAAAWSQWGSTEAVTAIASTPSRRQSEARARTVSRHASEPDSGGWASGQSRKIGRHPGPARMRQAAPASARRIAASRVRLRPSAWGWEPVPSVRTATPARRFAAAASAMRAPAPNVSSSACGAMTSHCALRQRVVDSRSAPTTAHPHPPRRHG